MNTKTYIIVDLEATCVSKTDPTNFQNEIIEIGAVKVDHEGNVLGEFQCFVQPILNRTLSDFCKELTTIEQSDVDNAILFPEAIADFIDWSANADGTFENVWFCSWGYYDKSQFRKDCDLHNIGTAWIDNHISLKHQHGAMIGIPRGVGMQAALRKLNLIPTGQHHRGIDDARNIANIFLSLFERWKY